MMYKNVYLKSWFIDHGFFREFLKKKLLQFI